VAVCIHTARAAVATMIMTAATATMTAVHRLMLWRSIPSQSFIECRITRGSAQKGPRSETALRGRHTTLPNCSGWPAAPSHRPSDRLHPGLEGSVSAPTQPTAERTLRRLSPPALEGFAGPATSSFLVPRRCEPRPATTQHCPRAPRGTPNNSPHVGGRSHLYFPGHAAAMPQTTPRLPVSIGCSLGLDAGYR
jgi:hypothetical protein